MAPADREDDDRRISRRRFLAGSAGALAVAGLPSIALAKPKCDPFSTKPHFRGVVPTPRHLLGFDLGTKEVKPNQSNELIRAFSASTDRVIGGQFATSWEGRPLYWAAVGKPSWVSPSGLAKLQDAARKLRDPKTPASTVADIAASTPAILWIAANVHGSEESGTDAALQVLYELADRDDCAVTDVLEQAVVFFIPCQNPDGRANNKRRNHYGFDCNRDWFARTQPETDAKVELLRTYPPVLFIDAHEFGFYRSFFPPNDDPVYHETSKQTLHWINDLYGPAFAKQFRRNGWAFFNYNAYDFFYPGYGDTVPTNVFQAAGITLEVYNGSPLPKRFPKHYTSYWAAIATASANKEAILRQLHTATSDAMSEGAAGHLQPNIVQAPGHVVKEKVPNRTVRHYFLRNTSGRRYELDTLVRRLQRTNVQVYRLSAPLSVPDYREYTRSPAKTTLPSGTYWIPMAQPQKHWIQDLLNEDTYPATAAFFDVSGWSNPLLGNIDGGSSGAVLHPAASLVPPVGQPTPPSVPAHAPRVGFYQMSHAGFAIESAGPTRWLFDNIWHLPYTDLTAADIMAGDLDGIDVLVVPGGGAKYGAVRLGSAGERALRNWVNDGGRYVGYRGGGARLAAKFGLSTAILRNPTADLPGTLLRARVHPDSPLADGVGEFVWIMFNSDDVMTSVPFGSTPIRYPDPASGDWFASGFSRGEHELYRRPAVADEPVGDGRVVIFPFDPNFRGFAQGTQRLLWNAIFGPDPANRTAPRAGSRARARAEAAARKAANLLSDDEPLRLTVKRRDAERTASILRGYKARFHAQRSGGDVRFLIANPHDLTAEEHPFAMQLPNDLRRRHIPIVVYSAP